MVIRHLDQALSTHFRTYKQVLMLLGARQVGKTTILKRIFPDAHYLPVDNEPIKTALNRYDPAVYRQLLRPDKKTIILDEIQRLTDPGLAAKIFYDQLPDYQLIVTGSSALNIKNKMSESLAGRKIEYQLFPLSFSEYLVQKEITDKLNFLFLPDIDSGESIDDRKIFPFDMQAILDSVLIYGLYPGLVEQPNDQLYLKNLVDSVIFRDILDLSLLENRPAALNLLKLLAYQIGSQVNFSELANNLSVEVKTVRKYITLFEQSFIIFTLLPFTSRKRDEIGKMPKIFFYDVGIRNALIDNFQPLSSRADAGQLFENFIVSETIKANRYGRFDFKLNYWRTKQGSEVDLVLTKSGKEPIGIEIKSRSQRVNKAFRSRYPKSKLVLINRFNFYAN